MKLRRLALGIGGVVGILLATFAVYVASRQNLRFELPPPQLVASHDPAVVARGEYVVRRLANCPYCHADPNRLRETLAGSDDVPLSGGRTWSIPPGTFRAYNITSDKRAGIGAVSDGQIARALRFGIGREGRALLPFMEIQGLADDDLVAVISYLRTLPASPNVVPPHDYNLLGRVVRATVLANPVGLKARPPEHAPSGPTVENGRYLAEHVANCWACHTERSMKTGELVGARFAGGDMEDDLQPARRTWHAPNLTPDPKTGRTGQMNEDQFVQRLRAGSVLEGSPMPWNNLAKLNEDDLRAIYRYLRTLDKVEHDMGPPFTDHSGQ
jgi:mono/diheme cytochrome c family protein